MSGEGGADLDQGKGKPSRRDTEMMYVQAPHNTASTSTEKPYDLSTAADEAKRERLRFIGLANKNLRALEKPGTSSTQGMVNKEGVKGKIIEDENRSTPSAQIPEAKYILPPGIEEEAHIHDRPPEIDPNMHQNFAQTVAEIIEKVDGNSESLTFTDLQSIIASEKVDMLTQGASYDRLAKAIPAAEEFLKHSGRIKKVNVSVFQNENGEWEANPGAKKGELHFTFTRSRILKIKREMKYYQLSLKALDYAYEGVTKMTGNKNLAENNYDAQAIYTFIREKIDLMEDSKKITKDPELQKAAGASLALFRKLRKKVYDYKTSISEI